MPNFQQILNEEVRRLARKEIKVQVSPMLKTVSDLKQQVRELRNQIKNLNDQILKSQDQTGIRKPAQEEEVSPAEKQIRLTAARIRACREKLGLSRKVFADLIGTTFVSVSNWENGKTVPRLSQKKKIVTVRDMGKRELVKLIAEKKTQKPQAVSAENAPVETAAAENASPAAAENAVESVQQ